MTRRRVLSADQVTAIRSEYQKGVRGYGYRELGRKYGVSESVIRDVIQYAQRCYA